MLRATPPKMFPDTPEGGFTTEEGEFPSSTDDVMPPSNSSDEGATQQGWMPPDGSSSGAGPSIADDANWPHYLDPSPAKRMCDVYEKGVPGDMANQPINFDVTPSKAQDLTGDSPAAQLEIVHPEPEVVVVALTSTTKRLKFNVVD